MTDIVTITAPLVNVYHRKVRGKSANSGIIYVPKSLKDKEVFVIVKEEEK